jgi:hypothetical protein
MFPNYSGSHTRHVVNQSLACNTCHGPYGSGSPTHGSNNRTAHNSNTFVNMTSTSAQFHFTWAGGTGKGTCSTNTCHASAEWGVTKLQCNSCHDYDSTDNWVTKSTYTYGTEGVGAHKKHISYLKTRLGVTLNASADSFTGGNGVAQAVCGTCHDLTSNAAHSMTKAVNTRTINFGGSTARQFGGSAPLYNGDSASSSATKPKSCSNTDCHFRTSPIWSNF